MKSLCFLGSCLIGASIFTSNIFAATPEEEDAAAGAKVVANLGKATVTLSSAVQTALAKFPGGHAVEALFEVDDKELQFYVEVIAAGKHHDVTIDAKIGKITAV